MAASCPKTTRIKSCSRFNKVALSSVETLLGGILAILATTLSTSFTVIVFFLLDNGKSIWDAPTSSMTSIALSGSFLSPIYRADKSTAHFNASNVYLTL